MTLHEINAVIRANSPYPLIRPATRHKGPYVALIGKRVGNLQHVAAVCVTPLELGQAKYPADIIQHHTKDAVAAIDHLLTCASECAAP